MIYVWGVIMDFVAIDFETANVHRSSACSLGLAIVQNGVVSIQKSWKIQPAPLYFDPFNSRINGMTENDVIDAPTFADLWQEVRPLLDGRTVVAHNASFDISVLQRTLEWYGLVCPDIQTLCTYRLSQRAFPRMGCHRLNIVCDAMDIPVQHHDALSDALACASVLNKLLAANEISTMKHFQDHFQLDPGFLRNHCSRFEDYAPCRSRACLPSPVKNRKAADFKNIVPVYIDEDFAGKSFVFTGTLHSMTRDKARELVALGGGTPQDSVTRNTDFLVVGIQDIVVTKGGVSGKMKKAYDMRENGLPIQVIGEDDFLAMIDEELYRACFGIS